MEREDFTFPITKTKINTKLEPWWSVTYSSSSSKNSENSDMQGGLKGGNAEEGMQDMDLLWEDFNDETTCRSCGEVAEADMASRRMTGSGCSGAFNKLVKVKGEDGGKPSAGVLIKLVKKVLNANSQQSTLRRSST